MANALKQRGSLTIWFDPGMAWAAKPTAKRGRQPIYIEAAVQTCLTMKVLFGMALRQIEPWSRHWVEAHGEAASSRACFA